MDLIKFHIYYSNFNYMNMKFVINEELGEKIKTLYLIDGLSCTKIGKEVGISTISSFLKRNGIEVVNKQIII